MPLHRGVPAAVGGSVQQVVVVGHLLLQFHLLVGVVDLGDLVGQALEEGEFLLRQRAHRGAGIAGVADAVGEVLGLGVVLRLDELRVDLLDGVLEDRFGLALVEDGEVALQPDLFTVHPEDALGDAVESAAPELASGDMGQVLDPLEHFRRFVRKGEKEDLPGWTPLCKR